MAFTDPTVAMKMLLKGHQGAGIAAANVDIRENVTASTQNLKS